MFTPASLLAIATAAEARYKALLAQFPPGTINRERNDAHDEMNRALACAVWMETSGHAELSHVGTFGQVNVVRGQRVRIKRGALVHSLHPSLPRDVVLERAQVVNLHFVDPGFVDPEGMRMRRGREESFSLVRQPRVTWSGTGGYWRSTDLTNVEVIARTCA